MITTIVLNELNCMINNTRELIVTTDAEQNTIKSPGQDTVIDT
ncbi:hypothetical protein [uncultured Eudoraea sp.]|nr:hypothetical protein [uncultured Eudoraea sp.]